MANKRVEETQKTSGRRKPLPGKRTTPVSDLFSLQEKYALLPAAEKKGSFPVVGIGASAGGLEAFEKFFRATPPDSGMAFILISHLNPSQKSFLPELIQRFTKMQVVEAAEGLAVEPNQVSIIPPNWDLSIQNRRFGLLEPPERALMRPVDSFFRSLAQDQGENAICIILSGTGTDGSLGLKAVKGEGGLILAQDPKEAAFDGMPSSAIATGFVDAILPASGMPRWLQSYYAHLKRLTPPHLIQILSSGFIRSYGFIRAKIFPFTNVTRFFAGSSKEWPCTRSRTFRIMPIISGTTPSR